MYWAIGYAVAGVLLSELTIWHLRRNGRPSMGPWDYLVIMALWPAVFAAVIVRVMKG